MNINALIIFMILHMDSKSFNIPQSINKRGLCFMRIKIWFVISATTTTKQTAASCKQKLVNVHLMFNGEAQSRAALLWCRIFKPSVCLVLWLHDLLVVSFNQHVNYSVHWGYSDSAENTTSTYKAWSQAVISFIYLIIHNFKGSLINTNTYLNAPGSET